ncbi:hypothetical protein HYV89_02100 [Candidatus Woesearchaeota archaeon]|nr:hypothetical protein [Candidatus Woesearchaeota archaeon]
MFNQKNILSLNNEEKIKDLPSLRREFDLNRLNERVTKRGDVEEISKKLKINRTVLSRGLYENRILSIFPDLNKSKVVSMSTIWLERELKVFSGIYDIQRLSTRKLYKKVKEWRRRLKLNPRLLLTDSQHDLIIGSILGDGYVRKRDKNCNFRVGHSDKQKEYLLWKYMTLKEFTSSEPKFSLRRFKENKSIKTLELSTFTHPVFSYYRRLFYPNEKKIVSRKILNLLTPRSLAYWVCDDGSYNNRQGYIVLCTNSYNLEEHEIMRKYFQEVWDLDPTIGFRDGKYYYLRFKQEDSKRLISIIKQFIPEGIEYKIGK